MIQAKIQNNKTEKGYKIEIMATGELHELIGETALFLTTLATKISENDKNVAEDFIDTIGAMIDLDIIKEAIENPNKNIMDICEEKLKELKAL